MACELSLKHVAATYRSTPRFSADYACRGTLAGIDIVGMLRFVTADSSSLGQKRKQSQRACEQCRKRKKRCDHSDARPTSTALRQPSPKQDGLIGTSITTEGSKPSTSGLIHFSKESEGFDAPPNFKQNATSPVQVSSTTDSNFSGQDAASIAGQALFDGRGESQSAFRNSEALGSRFIGDLNPEGIFLAATSPTSTTTANRHDSIGIWLVDKLSGTVQSCSGSLAEHAESHSFYGYSPLVQKVLLPLLIEECLSIVPPQTEFQVLYNIYLEKSHPIFPVLDKAAFESMNHTQPASILLKQGICLAASMNVDARNHLWLPSISSALSHREFGMRLSTAMRTSIGIGLVTEKIVLIQASILLSFFIEGPDGGDLSSQFCGNAVQLVQSIGLHVQNRRHDSKDQYAETLLCCVWARDRLNAAFHGRPVLMHLQDFAKDLESCFRRQDTCFQVFLRVIMLLDAVINLYRPASDRNALGWEGDFPSFEELLASSGGSHIPTPLLATIEIMYHAVAILSCRSRSFEEPQRSSTSYIRQTLSAAQIGSIVDQEFRDQLSFFPFVPYAVSLSLSVAYREMRHSKISMYRARARLKLQNICNILQSLSDIFWSASTLGDMGQATIREMDRVYSTVANSQHRENQQHTAPETLSAEHGGSADDRPPSPRNVNLRRNSEPEPDSSALNGDFYEQKDVNPSLLTADMQDFDVFELFDPNFDLDEIDACLGGNLDLSFHTNFQ